MKIRSRNAWDKAFSIILAVVILAALGILVYTLVTPKVGERLTEFYILGLEGKATDYPREMVVGEEGRVIVGIINREQKAVSYRVEIKIDGVTTSKLEPIALEHNGKFEQVVNLSLDKPGAEQQVEFLLYKEGKTDVYESLRLWVNVND